MTDFKVTEKIVVDGMLNLYTQLRLNDRIKKGSDEITLIKKGHGKYVRECKKEDMRLGWISKLIGVDNYQPVTENITIRDGKFTCEVTTPDSLKHIVDFKEKFVVVTEGKKLVGTLTITGKNYISPLLISQETLEKVYSKGRIDELIKLMKQSDPGDDDIPE